MIHVLHICDHLGWPGSRMHGAKRILEILLPRLDAQRFRPFLVSLRRRDLSEARLEDRGIPVTYLGRSKFDPRTLHDLVRFMRRQRIDVVHMHGYGASTFGRLAARIAGVPTIIHEHANLASPPRYQVLPDLLLASMTDYTIAVSETTRDFCLRWRRLPPDRVHVHYFGVDRVEYAPAAPGERAPARRQLNLPLDRPIVGTVTRLHEQKGNCYLVEAARGLVDAVPDCLVVIAGEGPLRPSLEGQVRDLGLADHVRFAGFVDSSRSIYVASDVVAFSSLWEGTPLTLFEAMSVGSPIVATAVDGNAEVLEDGRDALLVPARDAGALATAIIGLLENPERAARLAQAVERRAERYDVHNFVRALEGIYVRLADRGAHAAAADRPTGDQSAPSSSSNVPKSSV